MYAALRWSLRRQLSALRAPKACPSPSWLSDHEKASPELQREMRDRYVTDFGLNTGKDEFTALMRVHFGKGLTDHMKSLLLLSHHHVTKGKYAECGRGRKRPRKPRVVTVLLRTALTGDVSREKTFHKSSTLRDVQEDICSMYGREAGKSHTQ